MQRQMRRYVKVVEVAPEPIIVPHKASNAPKLETIAETEGFEQMDVGSPKIYDHPTPAQDPEMGKKKMIQQSTAKGFQENK